MNSAVELAREQLAHARAMYAEMAQQRHALVASLDPARTLVDPEVQRLVEECVAWADKELKAEHAVARAEHGTPGIAGAEGPYRWLTTPDYDISHLIRLCPQVFLGRRLAVTSIDSGPLRLTEEERTLGWWTSEERRLYRTLRPDDAREDREDWLIAHSPVIHSPGELPLEKHCECCDWYNEWFLFDRDFPASDIETFVNGPGFKLYDSDREWCLDRFWKQMLALDPESYLAEGYVFTFATRNHDLFDAVIRALSVEPPKE